MAVIKLFIAKYLLYIQLAVVGVLVAGLGVQTLRLASANTDIAKLEAKASKTTALQASSALLADQGHRATEQSITAKAEVTKKEDDEKIRTLAADASRLERLLRDRPHRPAVAANVPAPAASVGGGGASGPLATGAGLYSEDGSFLAREAARAKRILIERDSCLVQYEDARKRLNGEGAKK
jgi:hypothetical protein